MVDKCLCPDFELRGLEYEIWMLSGGERVLVDPRKREVVDTDTEFSIPLTNAELLSIYDYGKDY